MNVWHTTVDTLVSQGAGAQDRALALLRPGERERHARFRHDIDRQMFLVGRVMARAIVADALGVPAHDWPWREGLRGRPEIDRDDCPFSFNLAHSAGLVVCALSRTGPVGVDVEHRSRLPIEEHLIARCCSPDEAADVRACGPEWRDRFLQYWTLKESYLKATGLGVSVHLPDVQFRMAAAPTAAFSGTLAGQDAAWRFDLRTLPPHHHVAVASVVEADAPLAVQYAPFPDRWWP